MSESTPENRPASPEPPEPGEVTDEMLPEDLRPTDDNPLAQAPSDDDDEGGLSLGPDGPQA